MTMYQVLLDGITITDEYSNLIAEAANCQHATMIVHALNLVAEARMRHADEDGWIDPLDWDRFTAQDIVAVGEGETTFENIAWGQEDDYLGSPQDSEDRMKLRREEEERERRKLALWKGAIHD